MMTGRHGDRLDAWITDAEHSTLAPLAAFARNLRRDLDAVRHGLGLPDSSGPVEGNNNRVKCSSVRCSAGQAWISCENAYS